MLSGGFRGRMLRFVLDSVFCQSFLIFRLIDQVGTLSRDLTLLLEGGFPSLAFLHTTRRPLAKDTIHLSSYARPADLVRYRYFVRPLIS